MEVLPSPGPFLLCLFFLFLCSSSVNPQCALPVKRAASGSPTRPKRGATTAFAPALPPRNNFLQLAPKVVERYRRRVRRTGFPPPAAPAPVPVFASAPAPQPAFVPQPQPFFEEQPRQQFFRPQQQQFFEQQYQPPAPEPQPAPAESYQPAAFPAEEVPPPAPAQAPAPFEEQPIEQSVPEQRPVFQPPAPEPEPEQFATQPGQAAPPPPSPLPEPQFTTAAVITTPAPTTPAAERCELLRYPLPECYTDDSNLMCCNPELEDVMKTGFEDLVQEVDDFHRCNTQKIANRMQELSEQKFNTSFEVITGIGDYASRSHFYHNLICKIERDGRFVLAYASPKAGLDDVVVEGDTQTEGDGGEHGAAAVPYDGGEGSAKQGNRANAESIIHGKRRDPLKAGNEDQFNNFVFTFHRKSRR